ncbi:MAG TPA: diacylglycerol kinase family protein [Jatrophihabitans sp.]|nr:diacylglycerol kinase family protein [Jatrophihabitans sp.]
MGRRVAAVVNPAKVPDQAQLRRQIEEAAQAAGFEPVLWSETTVEDPGFGQARSALEQGAELVLACGGDGTVTACASALAESGAALALIPYGTGNLLARNLAVPSDAEQALQLAFAGERRAIDVVRCQPGSHFIVMAGLGFDAAMIAETNEDTKARIGWPAYIGGIVRALRVSHRTRFDIVVDGAIPFSVRGIGVLIGNVGELQAGLSVFPDASPTDEILDLIVFAPAGWRDWPLILGRLIGRRTSAGGRTETRRGRRIEITCDRPLQLEFDGDLYGPTSTFTAEVVPGGVTVCVPA